MVSVTVLLKSSGHPRFDTIIPHQSGDSVTATGLSLSLQYGMYAWITIRLSARLVYLHNLLQQDLIVELALTFLSAFPGIVAATSDI